MASLTRHHHTEQFSGILTTNTYLALTSKGREGWEKTKAQKAHKQQAIATTLCEELQASNCIIICHEVPLLEASGHP